MPTKKDEKVEAAPVCDNCDNKATYVSDGKVASVVNLCPAHAPKG